MPLQPALEEKLLRFSDTERASLEASARREGYTRPHDHSQNKNNFKDILLWPVQTRRVAGKRIAQEQIGIFPYSAL